MKSRPCSPYPINVPKAMSAIYESCFSSIGGHFCDTLVKEIAYWTGAHTVMIQRILSFQELQDLKENSLPSVQLVTAVDETYLFMKASCSKSQHPYL